MITPAGYDIPSDTNGICKGVALLVNNSMCLSFKFQMEQAVHHKPIKYSELHTSGKN